MSSVTFGRSTPIFRVADLDTSLAYYTGVLGFELDWRERGFAQVRRGEAPLMLGHGEQGHVGSWAYVGVSDADALHAELQHRGAIVRHPPTNYPWGARELHVRDPDGNVLRFGSDAVEGEPIGDWIDGAGVRWTPQADGGWREAE